MNPFANFELNSFIADVGTNPFSVFWFLFDNGGFFLLGMIVIIYAVLGWLQYARERCKRTRKYIVLQLNIPKENEQSMKAVEKIFVQLQGAANTPTFTEKWWDGWLQESFSFEIASTGGHIRFFVHLPEYYHDLVEAAIYAQYPDAEIFQVEDYTEEINTLMIEKKKIETWGAEMQLTKADWIPIRNYERFEHSLNGVYVDPMASILEVMSRLEPGEQIWFQVLITPMDPDEELKFRTDGNKNILKISNRDKLYGVSYASKKNALDVMTDAPIKALEIAGDQVFGSLTGDAAKDSSVVDKSLFLVEPERDLVKGIDAKVSQIVHKAKIRFIYIARKEQYQEFKGRRAVLGALFQYNGPNFLQQGRITTTNLQNYPFYGGEYIFPKYRMKRRRIKILRAYKSRDWQRGENFGHVFGVDELASLYHFPILEVRAPFVTKAETKRVEPPHQLETEPLEQNILPTEEEAEKNLSEEPAPQALPQEMEPGIPISVSGQAPQAPPAPQPQPTQPTQPTQSPQSPPPGAPPPNLPFV